MAMRASIVDDDQIANVDMRQGPVNGKLVVVFAQRADDVVDMVVGLVFLAGNGDVMIRAIHRRAHQVGGAGVQPDILLINMLFMDGGGHQTAVRAGHIAAKFAGDVYMHTGGNNHLLVQSAHIVCNLFNIRRRLLRAVGNAHAAGKVNHKKVCADHFMRLGRQFKEHPGDGGIIGGVSGVARQQRMQAKLLNAFALQNADGLEDLRAGHAIFGVPGMPHAGVANMQLAAGIVAQADFFRNAAVALEKFDMGNIVQIDNRAQLARVYIVLGGRHIGREHDVVALEAHGLGQHKFRNGSAIHPAALAFENGKYIRVGIGLDGEVFPKAGVPGKRRLHAPRRFTNAFFIVEMERRRVNRGDFPQFFGGTEGQLLHKYSSLHK